MTSPEGLEKKGSFWMAWSLTLDVGTPWLPYLLAVRTQARKDISDTPIAFSALPGMDAVVPVTAPAVISMHCLVFKLQIQSPRSAETRMSTD